MLVIIRHSADPRSLSLPRYENSHFSNEMQKREYFCKKTDNKLTTRQGGGGLVFQDRYLLDRLALTKKIRNGEIENKSTKIHSAGIKNLGP